MNINVDPRALSDEALCAFLGELHALAWHQIHADNLRMVEWLRDAARAEIARRIFVPWLPSGYDDSFLGRDYHWDV